jgi:hypothetical protein
MTWRIEVAPRKDVLCPQRLDQRITAQACPLLIHLDNDVLVVASLGAVEGEDRDAWDVLQLLAIGGMVGAVDRKPLVEDSSAVRPMAADTSDILAFVPTATTSSSRLRPKLIARRTLRAISSSFVVTAPPSKVPRTLVA